MVNIYETANELHIRKVVAYGKGADHKLYKEAAYTNAFTQIEIENLFTKGMLIVKDGNDYYAPAYIHGNHVNVVVKPGLYSAVFSASSTYAVGDYVTKDSKIYKCKTAISTAAAWDSSKWDEVTTLDFVEWSATAAD